MDAQSLHNILLHTFSTNNEARKAAEEAIAGLHHVRGAPLMLIQITMEQSVQREVRQAAAVSLKNLVGKYWEGEPDKQGMLVPVIPDEEKTVCRAQVLEALLQIRDTSLRALLAETVKVIAGLDFPTQWPTLIEEICRNLQGNDANRIINALLALRNVIKNFEYRSEERREPLEAALPVFFPIIRNMMTHLQSNENNSEEAGQMMHLILKTFWSTVQCHLPMYVAQVEELGAWMQLLRNVIVKPLEPLNPPEDEEERAKWVWWKLKKWTMQIIARFYSRWGSPKKVAENYQPMAEFFRSTVAPGLLPCVLETLALRKEVRYCTDRVIQLCLVFLQEAVDSSVTYKLLKPHLRFVLFDVIHPVLTLSQKDMVLWQEDPHEFVRKTNDVFEDFLSPVYAAENLLFELCSKRTKDCLEDVLVFYNNILRAYLAAPVAERDYIQKDAALHALFSLDTVLTKSSAHKHQVEAMIVNHILPEFANPHGFLRLRACRCFSRKFIEGIAFHDEATLKKIMEGMIQCIFDPELPVRIEAAKTLRFVVMYEHSDAGLEVLRPHLAKVLEQFFKLMDEIGNDEVVIALEHIIDRFSNEIGPFSVDLVSKLVECFSQFIVAGEDDEDASLAAVSCLDAVNTVLISIHQHPELYNLMLPVLVPVVERVLSDSDYIEYMESALEIMGTLAFYSNKINEQLWSLFPKLYLSFKSFAADYIMNFAPVIDNYVGRDIDGFVAGSAVLPDGNQVRYLDMVLDMTKSIFEQEHAESTDLCAACRIFYALLHNCLGRIDEVIPSMVHMTCVKLSQDVPEDNDLGAVTRNLFGVMGSLFHYNPILTMSELQKLNLVIPVFKLWVEISPKLTNFLDRKLYVLGIMSLLRMPVANLPDSVKTHMKSLIMSAAKVLAATLQSQEHTREDSFGEEVRLEDVLDAGGYASDEDAEAPQDSEYLEILRELREQSALGDGFGYDDDAEYTSMLDNVDEIEFFLSTLQGFAHNNSTEYQSLQLEADPDMQQAIAMFSAEHANRKAQADADN